MAPVDRNTFIFPYLLVVWQESLSQGAGALDDAASLDFGFTCESTSRFPLRGLVLLEVLVSWQHWGCTCSCPQLACYWVSGTSVSSAGTKRDVAEF